MQKVVSSFIEMFDLCHYSRPTSIRTAAMHWVFPKNLIHHALVWERFGNIIESINNVDTILTKKRIMVQQFFEFIKLILAKRSLIISMAKRELASQYIGSLFGLFWTFINPFVTIFVFWVIFSVGFKVRPVNDVPFVVWLAAGMAIWFCFSDIINGSTGVVVKYAQLIKKTFFPASILPLVKAVSGLFTHAVFLLVLVGLLIFQGMPFNLYWLQFLYYLCCMLVFALGTAWLLAALQVFVRDTVHFVGVLLQLGFWATPIFLGS